MKKFFKRKYERRLGDRAIGNKENRQFILDHLKNEWEEIEKTIARDRQREKLYRTAKEYGEVLGLTLLGMAAVCGVLVVGVVAPNVFSAFGRLNGRRRYFDKQSLQERMHYYNRRGYVRVRKDSKEKTMEIELTSLGEKKVLKHALANLKVIIPEKWDGVWRIVIFDIAEKNRWARGGLREYLKRMGFFPLQKSTFAFPYPCRKEIVFLCRLYGVGNQLRYIETSDISFDEDLKQFFSLGR